MEYSSPPLSFGQLYCKNALFATEESSGNRIFCCTNVDSSSSELPNAFLKAPFCFVYRRCNQLGRLTDEQTIPVPSSHCFFFTRTFFWRPCGPNEKQYARQTCSTIYTVSHEPEHLWNKQGHRWCGVTPAGRLPRLGVLPCSDSILCLLAHRFHHRESSRQRIHKLCKQHLLEPTYDLTSPNRMLLCCFRVLRHLFRWIMEAGHILFVSEII